MDLRNIRVENLHDYLRCSPQKVQELLRACSDDVFIKHRIPKRGRGTIREVWEVADEGTATIYKTLSTSLDGFFRTSLPGFPHPAAHAYVRGRSTLTNSTQHLGAKVLIKADVRDFFRSIGRSKIAALLLSTGIPRDSVESLASILVWDHHIPLGLHTSPTLANAVCLDLDRDLEQLAPGGCYTRYADDLTFSGPVLPSKEQVEEVLQRHSFEIADEKWRVCRRGRGLWVTGLSLEDGREPRIPKAMKRRIRQDIHFVARFGLNEHIGHRNYGSRQSGLNKINGTIRYIQGIEPRLGAVLFNKWSELAQTQGFSTELVATGPAQGRDALFLVDESVVPGPKGDVMLLCLTIVEDVLLVREKLRLLLEELELASDPATSPDVLRKEGLHWNRLASDDRAKAVEVLRGLPFRAFVAYQSLPSQKKDPYKNTYSRLLGKVIEKRLARFAGADVTVKLEENTKLKSSVIQKLVAEAYDELGRVGSRRPASAPATTIVSKREDDALPLPDLVLGIVAEFARVELKAAAVSGRTAKQVPGAQATRRFRQIEGKVKAIFDLDTGQVFSRRGPFRPWKPLS